ncbi:MAG: TetR/AcrR family transcriptional regulator [Treponema sp.]|nr:TetR/AcrR family transcriptional regulator [Treponema sp.]
MTPKQKYTEEKDELKSARMNRILQAAFDLFSEHGIDTIAMTDIAKKAEIGVASLYRYYETKDMVAIKTAIWAWEGQKKNILPLLEKSAFNGMKGLEQLNEICKMFGNLLEKETSFLRFIYFFDSYIIRQKVESEKLAEYEEIIKTVQTIVAAAIHKGIEDGSINAKYKEKESSLYFTLMHTMFSTAQKLSLSGGMLKMDTEASPKEQLELLTKLLVDGLK